VNGNIGSGMISYMTKKTDVAIGTHLRDHVLGGYRFLMENYKEGDRICLFGFSRGAFTARAVAGMLDKVGLLDRGNDENVPFAYKIYASQKEADIKMAKSFKETFSRFVTVHFVGVWYIQDVPSFLL
jgi:uncharacterized protein (DUF2235 family)